jgi:hypothetical protein
MFSLKMTGKSEVEPVLSDHLSYATFDHPHERSLKTGLTVFYYNSASLQVKVSKRGL